jgi:hypothetical protein
MVNNRTLTVTCLSFFLQGYDLFFLLLGPFEA